MDRYHFEHYCMYDVSRSGPAGDDPCLQILERHNAAEGEAAERDGGAAGDRWSLSLPFTPQSGSQTPPPALQTF